MSISWAVFAHLSCRSDGIVELQEKETEVSRQCRAGQGRFLPGSFGASGENQFIQQC